VFLGTEWSGSMKALPVRVSNRFTTDSARFDEDNLVSCAGLVPVLGLAQQTRLPEIGSRQVIWPHRWSPDHTQHVGIGLHRRRSVMVRMTPDGEQLGWVRFDDDPVALGLELAKAGPDPEVVLEATYGWYWAVAQLL
jgi:hypothetical protein